MAPVGSIPPIVPFPAASVRASTDATTWADIVTTYASALNLHLLLPSADFAAISAADTSLHTFLTSYFRELSLSTSRSTLVHSSAEKQLMQAAFRVLHRLLTLPEGKPPLELIHGQFLVSLALALPKAAALRTLLNTLWANHPDLLEASFTKLKSADILPLVLSPDKAREQQLSQIQISLHNLSVLVVVCPRASEVFIAGSDFLDALIELYNSQPTLRKAVLRVTQVAFTGLLTNNCRSNDGTTLEKPNYSLLFDHLYSFLAANPGSNEHSFLTALISETTFLQRLRSSSPDPEGNANASRMLSLISNLEKYTPRGDGRIRIPLHLAQKRKAQQSKAISKGKGKADSTIALKEEDVKISEYVLQVRDVFPELREAWVRAKLIEFGGDVESVVRGILEETIYDDTFVSPEPPTSPAISRRRSSATSHPPRPPLTRKNIYDDDALDTLSPTALSFLHIGKKAIADYVPAQPDSAAKQAIFSALAAFDSDDDERDDTYDAADVGGAVDTIDTEQGPPSKPPSTAAAAATTGEINPEQHLYTLYTSSTTAERASIFARDSATRRSNQRMELKNKIGWSDEAIEGWAFMIDKDVSGRRLREFERKYGPGSAGAGGGLNRASGLGRSKWQRPDGEEDGEEGDGGGWGRGGFRGGRGGGGGSFRGARGGGGGAGRGSGGGSGDGTGDATRGRARKEQHKGSRANHNRRQAHDKKMARGMGAPIV